MKWEWLNCLHAWEQIVKYDWDESELRWWSNDVMMKCGNMNVGERSIILFIFAYQILTNLKMKATPKGQGLPHVKKIWGGDSRKKKKRMGGDSRKKNKKNGRGLPQEKKKCIWRGLSQEKEKNDGDSRKRKRNVYSGDSRKWMMIWWGLPHEKGWDSSNVRGYEFDKQTWRGEELASHH